MLEVIDKGSASAAHPAPLLFVHGVMHGAWCWDEHFLDFFADKGYRALAVSLRGHANSTPKPRRLSSIADFVADVASVAESLPNPPVVIGHSMGGCIVQKYLESHDAPAGVLLASVPPRGVGPLMRRLLKAHPGRFTHTLLTTKLSHTFAATPEMARKLLFSEATSGADIARYTAQLDEEYVGRLIPDMALFALPRSRRVAAPVLVLGAEHDGLFTPREIHSTAAAYRTHAEIFPEMGHDMMLEPRWEAVAEHINAWLQATLPETELPRSG